MVTERRQVLVIGGGPAGIMAALSAAERGAAVTLWERNRSLGRKLAITGKGRCNITNHTTNEELVRHIPGNGAFLYSAFSRFSADISSPVIIWSLTVNIQSALAPSLAAFIYKAAASISVAKTPIFCHLERLAESS